MKQKYQYEMSKKDKVTRALLTTSYCKNTKCRTIHYGPWMATLTSSGYETFVQACKWCHMWLLVALPVLSAKMYLQVPLVDYLLSYIYKYGNLSSSKCTPSSTEMTPHACSTSREPQQIFCRCAHIWWPFWLEATAARLEKENSHNATLQVLPKQGMYITDSETVILIASPGIASFLGSATVVAGESLL